MLDAKINDGGFDARPINRWRVDAFGKQRLADLAAGVALADIAFVFGDFKLRFWDVKNLALLHANNIGPDPAWLRNVGMPQGGDAQWCPVLQPARVS